jgi:hypothetical protein
MLRRVGLRAILCVLVLLQIQTVLANSSRKGVPVGELTPREIEDRLQVRPLFYSISRPALIFHSLPIDGYSIERLYRLKRWFLRHSLLPASSAVCMKLHSLIGFFNTWANS